MSLNFLKLNDKKTEILVIGSIASVKRIDQSFDIDGIHIKPSPSIRCLIRSNSIIWISYFFSC